MSKYVSQLAILTGLDDETIKEQIIPYLDTFTTRQALVNHLQDLLGPGEAQHSFIDLYTKDKHPIKTEETAAIDAARPLSAAEASTINGSAGNVSKKKSRFPTKLPPPRKVEADTFGGVGSMYRKGEDNESLFPTSATSSGFSTPKERGESGASVGIGRSQSPVKRSTAKVNTSASDGKSASQVGGSERDFTLIPSDEMKAVQKDIVLLRGEGKEDPTAKAKPCFCQGRRHPIHPQVPLCMACGLVLCSILHPSPLLLPSSPCPSCAAPILNTTSRAILLARLDMQLASLSQLHEEKVRLIQEERQKAWQEKRQEVELFPDLIKLSLKDGIGSNSSNGPSSKQNQEYNHFYERRRAMDIAMGRRADDDTQRRARVIRIGGPIKSKKIKGNTGKKSAESTKESSKIPLEKIKVKEEEMPSSGDESGDDFTLDYDPRGEYNGPVPDPDDDGFARHGISIQPDQAANKRDGSGYWAYRGRMQSIKYKPAKERSSYVESNEAANGDVSERRLVPGALQSKE